MAHNKCNTPFASIISETFIYIEKVAEITRSQEGNCQRWETFRIYNLGDNVINWLIYIKRPLVSSSYKIKKKYN